MRGLVNWRVAAAAAVFVLGGCAFHHDDRSSPYREDYVDLESDPRRWGGHYHHEERWFEPGWDWR